MCPYIFNQNVEERALFLVWCFVGVYISISHYIIEGKHSISGGGGGVLCCNDYILYICQHFVCCGVWCVM